MRQFVRPLSRVRIEVDGFPAFHVATGTCLLDACEANGVPIDSACGGFAACNSCRVEVRDGASLSALVEEEEAFLDSPSQRLACQCEVIADVALRLAPGM